MNLVIDSGSGNGSNNGKGSGNNRGIGNGGLIYTVQAILVLAGLLLTIVTLIVALASRSGWPAIAGVLFSLVAYGSIAFYCLRGYRANDLRYYLGAVYGVATMLLFKSLVPLHTMLSQALITLGFGLLLVFAERINNRMQAKRIIVAALVVLLAEAITVLFMPIGTELTSLQNFLVRATPLSSLVLTGTLGLIYWNDLAR